MGGERVPVLGAGERGDHTRAGAGLRPRALRRRRHAADARRGLHRRYRAVRHRHPALPVEPPELADRLHVLGGHERVRQRLVAGDLRGRAALRGAGLLGRPAPRLPGRLPRARARARRRGAADRRLGARVSGYRLQPAGERRLAVGVELRLDVGAVRPDAVVRVGAGLRAPLLLGDEWAAGRPLRLRLAAPQRLGSLERRLPGAGRGDSRPPRLGNPRLRRHGRRSGEAGGRRLRPGRTVSVAATSPARPSPRRGSRSARGRRRRCRSRPQRRRSPPGSRPGR